MEPCRVCTLVVADGDAHHFDEDRIRIYKWDLSSLFFVHISAFSLDQRLIAPVEMSRGSSSFLYLRVQGGYPHHPPIPPSSL